MSLSLHHEVRERLEYEKGMRQTIDLSRGLDFLFAWKLRSASWEVVTLDKIEASSLSLLGFLLFISLLEGSLILIEFLPINACIGL